MEDNNQFEARDESPKKEFKDISTESSKTEFSDTNFDTENVSSAPPNQNLIIQNKNTKFCINCGSKIDKNASMCPSCGVVQSKISEERNTKFCTNCGSEIDSKAEICPKCGVRQSRSIGISGEKSPAIAALLSFLIVGLGQVYIGKPKRGIVLFIACIIFLMTGFLVIPMFGFLGCWLGSIYDAYMLAQGEPGPLSFIDHYTNEA